LIKRLNQIIRGWCNYHKHICFKKAFQTLDKNIFTGIWLWAKRRYSTKSKNWRKNRYFTKTEKRDWIFQTNTIRLLFASDFKIVRHVLIKFDANPYLPIYEDYYKKKRMLASF
jgi:RNA-directed DNA polymerase